MHAPAMSGREARDLLDKMLRENTLHLELDREIFEEVYGPREYKSHFDRFCRTGELPVVVIAFCQGKLWRDKL